MTTMTNEAEKKVMEQKNETINSGSFTTMAWDGADRTALDFDVFEAGIRTNSGLAIPDKKALIRKNSEGEKIYLATVSKNYKVVKHSEVVEKLESNMSLLGSNVKIRTILGTDGKSMQRLYTLNDHSIEVARRDYIAPVIRVVNSYDGSTAVGFMMDGMRQVCTNGMIGFSRVAEMKYRHFGLKGDVHELFDKTFEQLLAGFKKYTQVWSSWIGNGVNEERANLVIDYMPARIRPYLRDRMANDFKDDKWSLYNVFTAVITHDYIPSRSRSADLQKIKIGNYVTKLFTNNFIWEAPVEAVHEDIVKRFKKKEAEDEAIDVEVIEA